MKAFRLTAIFKNGQRFWVADCAVLEDAKNMANTILDGFGKGNDGDLHLNIYEIDRGMNSKDFQKILEEKRSIRHEYIQ